MGRIMVFSRKNQKLEFGHFAEMLMDDDDDGLQVKSRLGEK